VAIKVIKHTTGNMAAVHREANLLMSLSAPNVVQALHYATYIQAEKRVSVEAASGACATGSVTVRNWLGIQQSGASNTSSRGDGRTFVPIYGAHACGSSGSSSAGDDKEGFPQQQPLQTLPSLDVYVPACPVEEGSTAAAAEAVHQVAVHESAVHLQAVQQAETHLVLEYCNAGTLAGVAEGWCWEAGQRDDHMLERLVMLRDVSLGMQELHTQGAVHGHLVSGTRRYSSQEFLWNAECLRKVSGLWWMPGGEELWTLLC
jgi:hypothetical protein